MKQLSASLGTFWLISKGRGKFISEIEKICIRGLGEIKDTSFFPDSSESLLLLERILEAEGEYPPEPIPFLSFRVDFAQLVF